MAKNKEQLPLEDILALAKVSRVSVTVWASKRSECQQCIIDADITAEKLRGFDFDDYEHTVKEIYHCRLYAVNMGRYMFSQSSISLEKAVRTSWRKYQALMEGV